MGALGVPASVFEAREAVLQEEDVFSRGGCEDAVRVC
jgi:hypothetical protein